MKKLLLLASLAVATTSFAAQNGSVIQEFTGTSGNTVLEVPIMVEANVVDATKKRLEVTFDNGLSPDGTALRFILGDTVTGGSSKVATSRFTAKIVEADGTTLVSGAKVYGGLRRNGAAVATTATSTGLGAGADATIVYNLTGIETTNASASNSASGAISAQLTAAGSTAGTVTDASVIFELTAEGANN